MKTLPFNFEAPLSFFEKADAGAGKQRRIAGVISTESPDRQAEVVLQSGLDFAPFLEGGWYNDNHTKDTDGILGYPETVKSFRKGDNLPDGSRANTNCTWAEGYLLETDKATRIWDLGKALQKTGRRLGFSIEGRIERREGPRNKVIAKALVRNVAITNCPVNPDSRMEVLAKSLMAVETAEPDDVEKAMTVGTPTPGQQPVGPKTGEGAAGLLSPESLESDQRDLLADSKKKKKKKLQKSLSEDEAIAWVQSRIPGASSEVAMRFINATRALKGQGKL